MTAFTVGTPSVWEFLQRLEQSRLVSAEKLRELRQDLQLVGDTICTEALAKRLVREEVLTPWQSEMILSGRHTFHIGPYRLLDVVGRGGMGSVFRGEHVEGGYPVAIKVLSRQLASNRKVLAAFRREVEAASRIRSRHVVRALDSGVEDGRHYIVLEYVEGQSLSELLQQRGKLFVGEACEYVRQAAVGLHDGHKIGLVHRDIKPGNLILTWDAKQAPLIKILDFGLARYVWELDKPLAQAEKDGRTMGTPDYMAPEQARQNGLVDIRSDIFSLGCTLFRLLTGRFPFPGKTSKEKLLARQHVDAPPPSAFVPSIPPEVDRICRRMLAREPRDRYQSPIDVARDLAPFSAAPARSALLALQSRSLYDADTTVDAAAHETFSMELQNRKAADK